MRQDSAVITGLGLCTPLGANLPATWDALLAGEFITDNAFAAGDYAAPRVHEIAARAASQAVGDAGWSQSDLRDAALVVGTGKGPIEAWLSGSIAPAGLADVAARLAARFHLGFGPRLTLSTACASGLHALIRGAMLLGQGADRVLVVAAESSLHPLFLASFGRLGVLAPPAIGCRPFDQGRAGFLVSEAAAAVCLQSSGDGPRVERFAMAGDGLHLTGGDPTGRTLRRILASVIDGRPVDLIHAHGTGTIANDAVELAAIESCVPPPAPAVFSHKAALGHSLGAAGLISVVLNCRCHATGLIPPNARTERPLPARGVRLGRDVTSRPVRRSAAIASGFGGAAAAVTLSG